MDSTYSLKRERNYRWLFLVAGLVLILGGAGYLIFGRSGNLISPLPDTPAVEIIFYTPTPEPVTPTSSPSATPKPGAKKATVTAAPKKELTLTPTKSASVSATKAP